MCAIGRVPTLSSSPAGIGPTNSSSGLKRKQFCGVFLVPSYEIPSLPGSDDELGALGVLLCEMYTGRVGPYIATGSAGPKVSL